MCIRDRAIGAALKTGGNTSVTLVHLPGLNHLFQTATTGSPSEYTRIEETMSPAALDAITDTVPLTVKQDPRVKVPLASLSEQLSLQMALGDGMKRSYEALQQVHDLRRQLREIGARLESDLDGKQTLASVRALDERAQALQGRDPRSADPDAGFALAAGSGPASLATLNATFATLATIAGGADAAPTLQAREMFKEQRRDLGTQLAAWSLITSTQIPDLNRTLRERGLPAITIGESGK